MAEQYNEYLIEVTATRDGKWCAVVRRIDGQKIKTVDGGTFESIPTGEKFSRDDAVKEANPMINGGGMT